MTRSVSIVVGALLILGTGGFVYVQTAGEGDTRGARGADTSSMTTAAVASHNTGESCWTIINGGVYDLTAWIPEHPGGPQAILQLCGTDGSAKFNGQHGGKEPMMSILAGFKIGELAQ